MSEFTALVSVAAYVSIGTFFGALFGAMVGVYVGLRIGGSALVEMFKKELR